jgi:hypothetical protein
MDTLETGTAELVPRVRSEDNTHRPDKCVDDLPEEVLFLP